MSVQHLFLNFIENIFLDLACFLISALHKSLNIKHLRGAAGRANVSR
jgi:hypothetical protein